MIDVLTEEHERNSGLYRPDPFGRTIVHILKKQSEFSKSLQCTDFPSLPGLPITSLHFIWPLRGISQNKHYFPFLPIL